MKNPSLKGWIPGKTECTHSWVSWLYPVKLEICFYGALIDHGLCLVLFGGPFGGQGENCFETSFLSAPFLHWSRSHAGVMLSRPTNPFSPLLDEGHLVAPSVCGVWGCGVGFREVLLKLASHKSSQPYLWLWGHFVIVYTAEIQFFDPGVSSSWGGAKLCCCWPCFLEEERS